MINVMAKMLLRIGLQWWGNPIRPLGPKLQTGTGSWDRAAQHSLYGHFKNNDNTVDDQISVIGAN